MLSFVLIFNTFQNVYNLSTSFEIFLLSFIVVFISGSGIVLLHKNLIVVFMCIELFIVALSFNFIVVSVFYGGSFGFFFGYLLLITAGAESSLALSILTGYFFIEQHINVEFVSKLKG